MLFYNFNISYENVEYHVIARGKCSFTVRRNKFKASYKFKKGKMKYTERNTHDIGAPFKSVGLCKAAQKGFDEHMVEMILAGELE